MPEAAAGTKSTPPFLFFSQGPSDVADWGLLPVGGVYVYVPIQFVGGDGRGHILAQGPQLKISSFGKEKEELKK